MVNVTFSYSEPLVKIQVVILLLLLIIAVGSFLRIYDVGAESIWLDEAASIDLSAYHSVTSIIEKAAPTQNHPPFYFIVLHFWINLFGTSEVATRSLSAIFGIISILLIYQVGSALFNRRVGLISGFLSAISAYHIYYSQEVRSYSLLLLLSLLSYLFFIKILKQDRKWHYPCYFLTNLLLGYTHFYGLFIIISQIFFFLLFFNKYRLQRLKLSSTMVATIITFLPLVFLLGGRAATLAESGFWIGEPTLVSIISTFATFAGAGLGQLPILLAFFLLTIIGLFSTKMIENKWNWRKPLESLKGLSWNISLESVEEELLLIIWLSFSIIIPFIESKFMTPVYLTRYMTGASPALYLLVAKGIGNLNRKWLLYAVLIFIVVLSSFGLGDYYKNEVKAQWREVASFVEANSKVDSDIAVFCPSYIQTPFDYYYRGEIQKLELTIDVSDTQKIDAFVGNAIQEKNRLWLILSDGGTDSPIRDYLMNRYSSEAILIEKQFFGILVIVFDLSAPLQQKQVQGWAK